MNTVEFVDITRRLVCDGSAEATISNLEHPPGRRPPQTLVSQSNWFKSLDHDGKEMVESIIRDSIRNAVFHLFCILDGVEVVEGMGDKGSFELRFVKNGKEDQISPSDNFLHDLL